MRRYLSLLFLSCLMTLRADAQSRLLSGYVKDAQTHDALAGVLVRVVNTDIMASTDKNGHYSLKVAGSVTLEAIYLGYQRAVVKVSEQTTSKDIFLQADTRALSEVVVARGNYNVKAMSIVPSPAKIYFRGNDDFTESYAAIHENVFHNVSDQPLSTFSSDVDRASYSNVRRFLNNGSMPVPDAVRVEEMINYFDYHYKAPQGKDPVAIYSDMAVCPWNTRHQLVRIALQAKTIDTKDLPPSNLVFLIDVSGSMNEPNKLPLVKKAFKALVQQLRPQDRVAIVVYAGAAGEVLPSTSGDRKADIIKALEDLQPGGSTAGGEGITLAYNIAAKHFLKKGNNRVILATDGDFNVGPSSAGELERLIESKRDKGIYLSVLGFGMGNLKDVTMETIADKGNGNYAYIDNFEEARRTFVTEFGGTLFTIAKDVKLQVEFNPRFVQAYRLVGYENRVMQNEDFNNDKKDAGDMGMGHTVTALYEIIPTGAKGEKVNWVDPLKYQQPKIIGSGSEVLTVKMRYKQPDSNTSALVEEVLRYNDNKIESSNSDFRMAAAVAAFGQLLRNSAFKGTATYDQVLTWATSAKGDDPEGYRAEFIQLVKKAKLLDK
ncbi:YfbK domain-containing protein [Chitinophaga vietnamensis]|uniref:YfbK domain-containing protein n=1 Tax=Chitinophaga vietnamensis TaxID=2593957 RepID=UPI001177BFF0|nr:von Willebrand factor type A domain-containing protein [Chitinophaga vietnamensis]